MTGPMQRIIALMKKKGYTTAIAEHFNPWGRVRVDLFGFIDLCCIQEGVCGVLAIQTTSSSNISARKIKIEVLPAAKTWLKTENGLWVIGFRKNSKGRWIPTGWEAKIFNNVVSWEQIVLP